jgi:hypothetical protein
MTGAATRMHGYVALWGLGITLIRNQIVEARPKIKKEILTLIFFPISL